MKRELIIAANIDWNLTGSPVSRIMKLAGNMAATFWSAFTHEVNVIDFASRVFITNSLLREIIELDPDKTYSQTVKWSNFSLCVTLVSSRPRRESLIRVPFNLIRGRLKHSSDYLRSARVHEEEAREQITGSWRRGGGNERPINMNNVFALRREISTSRATGAKKQFLPQL